MSDRLFPSGQWTGFYNYTPGDKHRMEMHLTFARGGIAGEGRDDIGAFLIRGKYDVETRECHWTKTYPGSHDVFYRGFREGKGIWGKWEIGLASGGFHIWPRHEESGEMRAKAEEEPAPLKVIGVEQGSPA